jgi:hypothetical protein
MERERGVPPGVHRRAETPINRQVRILGDDVRGYLLVGLESPDRGGLDQLWFPTLSEAIAEAEQRGIPRTAWSDIASVAEVPLEPPS